jgi:hypothetical protein
LGPEISVIVVNWNRRELLRRALFSLRAPTKSTLEVLVIDNGSADGSVEMVREEFAAARVIVNSENRGFCAANNQGISAARGRFVALLNNDAEAEPGWLDALRGGFNLGDDVGMTASKILVYEDPRRIDKAGHLIYPDGQNRGRGTGMLDQGQFDRVEEVLWPDGCAAMYRKRMLEEVGGFDEDFFAYGDDAELGLRARIAGWRCIYVPQAVVRHHRGATLGLQSGRRLELIERNRVLLALKLFPGSLLCLNPIFYLVRLAAGILASAGGKGETVLYPGWTGRWRMARALLRGDLEALRIAPRMLRKRREIERLRKLSPAGVWRLIWRHRISLRELMTHSAVR